MKNRHVPGGTAVSTPVYLNVYDLHPANSYGLYQLGFGAFHTGVEVNGAEYAYGGGDSGGSGVFDHQPRAMVEMARQQGQEIEFRETILVGYSDMRSMEISAVVDRLRGDFRANQYNVLKWNCNTFSDRLCRALLDGTGIPTWVNRLAWAGSQFLCLLPDSWGLNKPSPADYADAGSNQASERAPLFPGDGRSIGVGSDSVADDDQVQERGGGQDSHGFVEEGSASTSARERMLAAAEARAGARSRM